jgi:hypothetical protein
VQLDFEDNHRGVATTPKSSCPGAKLILPSSNENVTSPGKGRAITEELPAFGRQTHIP